MLRILVRLVVLGLVVHAAVRVGPPFWNYLQLKDAVGETATFQGNRSPEQMTQRVILLARFHDVELAPEQVEITKDGATTYIRARYTKQLEYVPTKFYPWAFVIDVAGQPPRYGSLVP